MYARILLLVALASCSEYPPQYALDTSSPCWSCEAWESCVYPGEQCVVAPRSRWKLTAESGIVSRLNSVGESWDTSDGLPDPIVCVSLSPTPICSNTANDTFNPQWEEVLVDSVDAGSLRAGVFVEYWDDDDPTREKICEGYVYANEFDFQIGQLNFDCGDTGNRVIFRLDFTGRST